VKGLRVGSDHGFLSVEREAFVRFKASNSIFELTSIIHRGFGVRLAFVHLRSTSIGFRKNGTGNVWPIKKG
jgi:hypothetical protein